MESEFCFVVIYERFTCKRADGTIHELGTLYTNVGPFSLRPMYRGVFSSPSLEAVEWLESRGFMLEANEWELFNQDRYVSQPDGDEYTRSISAEIRHISKIAPPHEFAVRPFPFPTSPLSKD